MRAKGNDEIQITKLNGSQRVEISRWLQLGVLSLAIAGLFAILLVLSRSPGIGALFPWIDFFRTALVVHVDQSVLVWFLAMAGVVWVIAEREHAVVGIWRDTAVVLAFLGTVGIAASAFVGDGLPLLNNYIPVLQRTPFFIALGLFTVGIVLRLIPALFPARPGAWFSGQPNIIEVAAFTVAWVCIIAILSVIWSWRTIPPSLEGEVYFEFLFWSGGHTLQFAYTQLMLLAWILLARLSGIRLPLNQRALSLILFLGVLPVLAVPMIHTLHPVASGESRLAFTRLMQFGGGVAAIPIGLAIFYGLISSKSPVEGAQRPLRLALWMSVLLFAAGGIIGVSISGMNTVIPAHYHGSIVGVTLALMGLAYLMLPRLGYVAVSGRLACAQPLVYGIGQMLHILGLALSGALGVARKTAGADQGLEGLGAKVTMGVMGVGGLLAVIGGILFVWIMLRAFWKQKIFQF